jgi:hypothetical protein
MTGEKLFYAIGQISDEKIMEADSNALMQAKPLKAKLIRWMPAAACLAVALALAVAIPLMQRDRGTPAIGTEVYAPEIAEIAVVYDYLDIYYVTDENTIVSESVYTKYDAEDIFSKWAELNKVEGVTLVHYFFSDNGAETVIEYPDDPSNSIVQYTVGDRYTLDITLSPEFASYADGENGQLLIESLKTTFTNYHAPIEIAEFNLIISE